MLDCELTEFHAIRGLPLKAIKSLGPIEVRSVNVMCSEAMRSFRAQLSAAPLKRRFVATRLKTNLKDSQRRGYTLAIVIRLDAAEMPSGRCTFQRRSLWSTCRIRLALPGGWLMGASTRRKSDPIWTTGIDPPLTNSLIFTWAEWPP